MLMKFGLFARLAIYLFLLGLALSKETQFEYTDTEQEPENRDVDVREPEKELERIQDYIYEYADKMQKNANINIKKIEIGSLPDSYPKEMRERARKMRQDRKIWDPVMLYPTSVWRMCVYPNFKISYTNWCKQNLALSPSKMKFQGKALSNLSLFKQFLPGLLR